MIDMLVLAVLLLILVAFALDAYHTARAHEARDRREAARFRTMDAALTDERGSCWVCQAPAPVLELVDAGRRFELACMACAAALKALKAEAA